MDVHKSIIKNPGPGTYQLPSDFGYLTLTPKNHEKVVRATSKVYNAKITNSIKGKRRSVNPIAIPSIV